MPWSEEFAKKRKSNFVLGNKFIVKQKKVFESIGIPTTKTKGSSRGNRKMDIMLPF